MKEVNIEKGGDRPERKGQTYVKGESKLFCVKGS